MFNEKKRLSLDDFKAQANNADTTAMMDSIKGGVTDSCHTHSGPKCTACGASSIDDPILP